MAGLESPETSGQSHRHSHASDGDDGDDDDGDDDDGDDHHNLRVTDNQNHLSFDDGPSFLWYRRAAQLLNSPSGYFIL